MKGFYITTPIFYVNDKPHLGTAYCAVIADILNRYYKLFSEGDSYFLTGTDEHGQKCEQAAKKNGTEPQAYCDQMVESFKETWKEFQVEYDIFFRTTETYHKKAVQKVLEQLYKKGDIYKGQYEGWYCVSEEIFYTEKDLVNGKTPSGKEVTKVFEEGYFFRMSKYQEALIRYIHDHPSFISPIQRRNEVLGFLKDPLQDLSISRPKSRLKWGIELPFDSNYVCYVWFDALLNYCTAIGLAQENRREEFKKWWKDIGAFHLIGKDILITHAVYWPTILMSLELNLPRQIFSTGWILNKESEKMSKSKGDVIHPLDLKSKVGVEVIRYFFARSVPMGKDAPFSYQLLIELNNGELSNIFGNLLSRITQLIHKHFKGLYPSLLSNITQDESTKNLIKKAKSLPLLVKEHIMNQRLHLGLESVIEVLRSTNQFIDEKAPWKTVLSDKKKAGESLATALECIRIGGVLLSPIFPRTSKELLKRLQCEDHKFHEASKWGLIQEGTPILKGEGLFPRF